jgi:cell division protein FtsI (penicillin-binding protein 3)
MQMALGVSAIANGGKLMEPILVKRITDSTGVTLDEPKTRVRRAAVGPAVSRLLSEMLVSVTEGEGTGVEASIPGFKVAGKTATAQKIDIETGRYTDTHYVASFVGFVPADKPRFAIAVAIDEPMAGTYAGGSVAAPVFRRVAEMALRYTGVTPQGSDDKKAPDIAKTADPAEAAYKALSKSEEPAEAAPPKRAGRALAAGEVEVPDLAGFPAREAIKQLGALGLGAQIEGTGRVLKQEPAAGAAAKRGTTVRLIFEPPT